MDQYIEEHKSIGYGAKLANSFWGIIFGILFLIVSVILLWWNESKGFAQTQALMQMQKDTVVLSNAKLDASNHNKPVWVYGEVEPLKTIVDTKFGVKYDGLKLQREVSMYQWKESKYTETKENSGGTSQKVTKYTYDKNWFSYHIDSFPFKIKEGHKNPSSMPYKSITFVSDAKLDTFYLSKNIISKLPLSREYPIDKFVSHIASNYSDFFYIGENPDTPKIGDMKIKYLVSPKKDYTIVAKQFHNSLKNYKGSNDADFFFIRSGKVPLETIFEEEMSFNSLLTWGLRVLGLFLMFLGFILILSPLLALASFIPVLGSFVGGAVALVSFIITFILGGAIITIAWIGARPWVLGVIIILVLVLSIYSIKKRKTVSPPPRR